MQGRNGDADAEDGPVDTKGEGENGMDGESSTSIDTPPMCETPAGEKLLFDTGSPVWRSEMSQEGEEGTGGREQVSLVAKTLKE